MLKHTLVPLLLLSTACGAPSGSSATASINLTAVNSSPQALVAAPHGADAGGGVFTLTSAKAYIRDVRLYLPHEKSCDGVPQTAEAVGPRSDADGQVAGLTCDGNHTIHIRGPFLVDLLSGQAPEGLTSVVLPATTYRRVDVRLDKAEPADGVVAATDPLAGNTLQASGTYAYNGASTPFSLSLRFNEDARFEDPNGMSLAAGLASTVMLHLDVNAWFSNLPVAECQGKGDLTTDNGTLIIADGHGSCSNIENSLKDAIEASAKLAVH
ncbi:MAG TPA: hypothetical protein VFH51_03710 [Myxococcota bacterium]|nr:hypothetical protein [Myxococcota bacterium]